MNAAAGPVIVVTGAAQGIGLATAERLARDGWEVARTDRQPGPGIRTCDVTVAAQVDALIAAARAGDVGEIRRLLQVIVPEYQPAEAAVEPVASITA